MTQDSQSRSNFDGLKFKRSNFDTARLHLIPIATLLAVGLVATLTSFVPAIAQDSSVTSFSNSRLNSRHFPVLSNLEPIAQATESPQDAIAMRMSALKQSSDRWIEIRLETQRLIAWEGNQPVYAIIVSTGQEGAPTRVGSFAIQSKHEIARMQGQTYDVPDVPFTMYYDGHYAIHGAYWHHRFGTPVSHGCVNLAVNHAEWLFNWAAIGTPVIVHP